MHTHDAQPETPISAADKFITVAVPTFNRANWLKYCLLAIFDQCYTNFEIIVSDNASTDGTSALLATISDRRLRVIRQKSNIGLLPNWNACLTAAKGDYIVFVSDDDRIAPRFLDRCIGLIRTEPDLNIIVGLNRTYVALNGEYCVTDKGKIIPEYASKRLRTGICNGSDILIEFFKQRIGVQMCTILMRTESVRARGGFPIDMPYAADIAIWVPLLLTGKSGFLNECCGTNIAHGESQTSKHSVDILLRDHREAINQVMTVADRSIENKMTRGKIKKEASRNIAHTLIDTLIWARIHGERLLIILQLVWRYRREIVEGEVSRLAILVQFLLLPTPLAVAVRDIFGGVRAAAANIPALKRFYRKFKRGE
jgi:glycosyltransferase involved in cell wall biosynthesis